MKKYGVIVLLLSCLTFVSYIYLQSDDHEEIKDVYLKTVVFQDEDHDLIPISVNLHSEVELEQEVRNRIEIMKSNDFHSYGLYSVLHPKLEVLSVNQNQQTLILNVNGYLTYDKQRQLDTLEALTFVLTDYEGINQLQLQVNGKNITHFPSSSIPVSSLNKNLGLNNFIDTSLSLHETIPVMVYNEKVLNDHSYYIPTTFRVNENDNIKKQVKTILSHIEEKIHVIDVSLKKGTLEVELDSNILLDNENIDQTLEELIILSLSHLQNVKNVNLKINGEDVRTQKTSIIQYNYIKI